MENLKEFYEEIIEMMPGEFNAHRFILKLAEKHQREYVQALYACAENNPGNKAIFQILHGQMANALHQYKNLVEKKGDESSTDIFGNSNSASTWRKV